MEGRTEGVTGFHLSYRLFPTGLSLFILSLRARNSSSRKHACTRGYSEGASFLCSADWAFLPAARYKRRAEVFNLL